MSDWVVTLIDKNGYIGVGLVMFMETVFPMISSEVFMMVSVVDAIQGSLTIPGLISSGTEGAILDNLFWY